MPETGSQQVGTTAVASAAARHEPLLSAVLCVSLAVVIGFVLWVGRPIFVPIVAAILIVFVIRGLTLVIARLPVVGPATPGWAHGFVASAILIVALSEIAYLFISNIGLLAQRAPAYQQALLAAIQSGAVILGVEKEPTWETVRAGILSGLDLPRLLRSIVNSASSFLGMYVFVLLNVVFLLLERRTFEAKLGRLSSDAGTVAWLRLLVADINARVGRYLAVKTLLNILLGIVSWTIMVAMGVEFAALWAMMIAVFNYIPYFGSFIGVAFPVAVAVAQFGDPATVLQLLVLLALAQFLIGNVIEPQVMGSSLNLSPWVILVSLASWASLWGVPGAVFSVPLTAILVVVLSEFARTRPVAVLMSKDGRIGPPEGGA